MHYFKENPKLLSDKILDLLPTLEQSFNFSDFPQNLTPVSCVLNLECEVVSTACHVSAYYAPGTNGVNQNITWGNQPNVNELINYNYINAMGEWYTYASTSFSEAANQACQQRSSITVCLKTETPDIAQQGFITFVSNARLDVYYTPQASRSTPEFPSTAIMLTLAVAVTFSALVYRKRFLKK